MYGALFMMAGAYTLSRNGHVRGDFIYRLWPPRVQAAIDLALFILFFLPGFGALFCYGFPMPRILAIREVSVYSPAESPFFRSRR